MYQKKGRIWYFMTLLDVSGVLSCFLLGSCVYGMGRLGKQKHWTWRRRTKL